MSGDRDAFEAIVREVEHDGLSFDMRCFLVPHASGLVLIDTGLPGNVGLIAAGLERTGARWTDVTDVVLTHGHFDHVASLGDVVALTADAVVWAGEEDIAQIGLPGPVRALGDGDRVRDLRVMATPGHTPGHRSLVHEGAGLLFTGDVLGTMGGVLGRAPPSTRQTPSSPSGPSAGWLRRTGGGWSSRTAGRSPTRMGTFAG